MPSLRPAFNLELHSLSRSALGTGLPVRPRTASREPAGSRRIAAAAAATSFEWWEGQLPQWKSSTLKPQTIDPEDASKLAAAVKSAASSYVPRPSLRVPTIDDLPDDLPADLHSRLELVAKVQLQSYLQAADFEPTELAYTTTDISAALQVAGAIVSGPRGREALVSLVACETERQLTWSRLDGLIFHWAASREAGGKWELPPRGWRTLPDTTTDAGGAWQSVFEKHPLPGAPLPGAPPMAMFTLLVTVPLEGPTEKGGLTFVLKSGNTGQNTKWLKDASTGKDFFLNLQKLTPKPK